VPPRVVAVPLKPGVYRTVKWRNGKVLKEYWYYQENRGKKGAVKGPRIPLPHRDDPRFLEEMTRVTTKTERPEVTIGDVIDGYLASVAFTSKSENTQSTYLVALKVIRAQWGAIDPASISIAGVMSLLGSVGDRPSLANMVRVMATMILKLCVQRGLRPDNPAREVDKLEEKVDGAKPIPPGAWAALMSDDAPEPLRRLAVLGKATGQRISDLIRMRPCDRDQDGIVTTITKLKGKTHWCPLTQEQAATIDGWNQFAAATYILRPDGKRYTEDTLRYLWNTFLESPAGAPLRGYTPHDLRATKVCDERISGKSHQQISAMVGMSVGMVMKYSKHIDQRLAARGT
jgi:integrase